MRRPLPNSKLPKKHRERLKLLESRSRNDWQILLKLRDSPINKPLSRQLLLRENMFLCLTVTPSAGAQKSKL